MKEENQISIIINGVRYDSVECVGCKSCDLYELCNKFVTDSSNLCSKILGIHKVFKKSDKKFEV
jgi:hypothetical protein